MPSYKPEEVNAAFDLIEPEILSSPYARYPMQFERWLGFDEKFEGNPSFIPSNTDEGFRKNYVYCKYGPVGKGYYHLLTKVSWNNLYSKLMNEGPGTGCGCSGDSRGRVDAHDTTRRIVYNRSRSNIPDDYKAAEQAINHMAGTKLNPLHGITG